MVPTDCGSLSSAMLAENWAESAMTVMPHTMATAMMIEGGPPSSQPIDAAHAPLAAIVPMVTVVRPHRSAQTPPSQAPSAPAAIAANVTISARPR